MNEELDEQSRQALITYRIERAKETVKEAELLASDKYFNAAINRLYYAVFYATQALLLNAKITTRTHAGVKTMLGLNFISKGVLSPKYGKTFNSLFNLRHSNDYDDFVYCDQETVDEYIPRAKEYIQAIEHLLANN